MLIGIIVALPEELSTLTPKKLMRGQSLFINEDLVIMYSGTGRENAITAANKLISKGVKGLISWGCAGALAPNLASGTLLFPETIITATGETLNVSENWLTHVKKNLPIVHRSVILVESLSLIESPEEKQQLHEKNQAVAVDMESAAIVQAAQTAGIYSLVIRTISDSVDIQLPSIISKSMNAEGEVQQDKLLRLLLTHPQQLPALIKVGFHFQAAKNKLKAVSQHLDTIVNF
ncbi:MAG: phosphorylase [Methylococcales bacterium]|nr:phosphorylase [Methylococcales bacterium]